MRAIRRTFLLLAPLLGGAACEEAAPPDEPTPEETPLAERLVLGPDAAARVGAAERRLAAEPSDPARRLELAMLLDSYQQWPAARAAYDRCLELEPDAPRAWYHRGRVRAELGDPEGALADLTRARELAPDYAPVHWRIGDLCLELDRLDEAEAAYREAARLAPDDPTPSVGLARVALQAERPREAMRLLEELLERDRDAPYAANLLRRAYLQAGDELRAQALEAPAAGPERALVVDPWTAEVQALSGAYEAALDEARTALADEDPARATALLRPLREEQPGNPVVIELLVHASLQRGDPAGALRWLDAPVAPRDEPRMAMNRGLVHLRAGEPEDALGELERATAADPGLGPGFALLGEAYAALDRAPEGIAALERAHELGERSARTMILLGRLYLAEKRFGWATNILEQATSEYPEEPTAWGNLALALATRGRLRPARAALERARSLAPEDPFVAQVGEQIDRFQEAMRSR